MSHAQYGGRVPRAGHEAPLPPDIQGRLEEALSDMVGQSSDMVREVREDMQALQLTMMHQLHLHQVQAPAPS